MFYLLVIWLPVVAVFGENTNNQTITSFQRAKQLAKKIYERHRTTLYSQCWYDEQQQLQLEDCLFTPPHPSKRAQKIEWEHVVPAHRFGQVSLAWQQGHPKCINNKGRSYRGRKCASKVDSTFRRIEADLYNLVPEIGTLNQLRGDLPMVFISPAASIYGIDGMLISAQGFQPPAPARGDIARIYLYMAQAYPDHIQLSLVEQQQYQQWHEQDPADAWECERSTLIAQVQGNLQPFLQETCQRTVTSKDLLLSQPTTSGQ